MSENNGHKDATILAVPAIAYGPRPARVGLTPAEQLVHTKGLLAETQTELQQVRVAASTIANIACSLMKMIDRGDEVTVPKAVHEAVEGAAITVREGPLGDLIVSISDRSPNPVQIVA